MSNFFEQKVEVVEVAPDHTITIRIPTFSEAMELGAAARKHGGDSVEQAGFFIFQHAPLKLILSWDGEGFGGAPVTEANIKLLPTEIVAPVAKRCAELVTKGLKESVKK